MSDTHDRWMHRLRRTWPEGVPAVRPEEISRTVEPWPDTERGDYMMRCLHCAHYVPLSGELGADWGACAAEKSQYDGQLVFEHWTCREYVPKPDDKG